MVFTHSATSNTTTRRLYGSSYQTAVAAAVAVAVKAVVPLIGRVKSWPAVSPGMWGPWGAAEGVK